MLFLALATACAGIFFGAAVYINFVEHPARVSCGPELAVREFAPSYQRAAVMQGALAVLGCVIGLLAAWLLRDILAGVAAVLLGLVVPFTLVVIFPTNQRLLDRSLDPTTAAASVLLARWNALHAVRSGLSGVAFALLLFRLASGGAT
jgi:anthrone oxygenase-like protein